MSTPKIGGNYFHKVSNKLYIVSGFTNMETTQPEKFPKTVIYTECEYPFNVWSRPIIDFNEKFDPL